jgi:bifunctional DNA-binding transcriptional regulator/antitoxin component of YhaV-PrlF toxin-antitoxin module
LGRADLSGVREAAATFEPTGDERQWVERRGEHAYWLRPKPDGSLVLPKAVAEALGLAEGRRVFAEFKDGELSLVSFDAAFERARAIIRKFVPPGSNVVDEFIAERRAMWGEDDDAGGA